MNTTNTTRGIFRLWTATSKRTHRDVVRSNFYSTVAFPGRTTLSQLAVLGGYSNGGSLKYLNFCTGTSMTDIPLSSTTRNMSSSKSNLLELLAREEQEEIDTGNLEMPYELMNLRDTIQSSWTIFEDGPTTTLAKNSSSSSTSTTIRLSFHCQDALENEEEEIDDDEEDEVSSPVRFTVTVTKNDKSSLTFACLSEDGAATIEGISTTTLSSPSYVHDNQGQLPKGEYQGPDFAELAEDVQEAFYSYLEEECGVDSDVAAFVAMSSDHREQSNYVDFLKLAQSIVS